MDGSLLPPDVIATLDHDSILDARDGNVEFEAEWTRCFNEIEATWPTANVTKASAAISEDIRRESFLTVGRATGQHEVASYVSDDFDIIVRGSILDLEDEFLNNLWRAYDRNKIPHPNTSK